MVYKIPFRFSEKATDYKMCLVFSATLNQNISRSKNTSARFCHKYENVFMRSSPYSCQIFIIFELSGYFFKGNLNIKFFRNLRRQTKGRTFMTKLIVTVCIFPNSPKHTEALVIGGKEIPLEVNVGKTMFMVTYRYQKAEKIQHDNR
jgi:hypothetical protein